MSEPEHITNNRQTISKEEKQSRAPYLDHKVHDYASIEPKSRDLTLIPTDEFVCAAIGLSNTIDWIKYGLTRANSYLGLFITAADRAIEADYRHLERLPSYEHMNSRQRLKALTTLVKDREHLSNQ